MDYSMAVSVCAMAVCLLLQSWLCSAGQTESGCMKWTFHGNETCCEVCHPGNHLVKLCGDLPRLLCTPCEKNTFSMKPKDNRCERCRECVEALVELEACTATTDTKCGCKEGLLCGDDRCSFCVTKCDRGTEPTEDRSCRPCPNGTFNNQSHQKCEPWSIRCPNPDQQIVAHGDAFNDIKCDILTGKVKKPTKPDDTDWGWLLALFVLISIALTFTIISIVTMKLHQKRKTKKAQITKPPIIRTPTDDPRTLIAIECSFHEAQQEQGSSSESLASKDSSLPLI